MKNKKYKNPLNKAVLLWCLSLSIAFSLIIGYMNFTVYSEDMLERYQIYSRDVLNMVARRIDGDDLAQCIRTKTKSAKYNELQILMNDVKETHDLEFLYIILPLSKNPPDNMMDVLAAYTQAGKEAGTDGLTDLGVLTGDSYPADVAINYIKRMDKSEEVTFFSNNTVFGNLYTAVRPILNSHGYPVAVLCSDIRIEEIDSAFIKFVTLSVLTAIAASFIVVLYMSNWLNRRIVNPIERLKTSAESFAVKCHNQENRNKLEAFTFDDPNIHTDDELEALSDALSSMCSYMRSYAIEIIKSERQLISMKEQVKKMDKIAYKDALTGAGNKTAYEKIKMRLDWSIKYGQTHFIILMVDLNYLKRINDKYGHDSGNYYIKKMYDILNENFADSLIFRIGGDEFVIIVENQDIDYCNKVIEHLKSTMTQLNENASLKPWEKISAAIGIAVYDTEIDKSVDEVFKRADAAMYEDKRAMHAGRE